MQRSCKVQVGLYTDYNYSEHVYWEPFSESSCKNDENMTMYDKVGGSLNVKTTNKHQNTKIYAEYS